MSEQKRAAYHRKTSNPGTAAGIKATSGFDFEQRRDAYSDVGRAASKFLKDRGLSVSFHYGSRENAEKSGYSNKEKTE